MCVYHCSNLLYFHVYPAVSSDHRMLCLEEGGTRTQEEMEDGGRGGGDKGVQGGGDLICDFSSQERGTLLSIYSVYSIKLKQSAVGKCDPQRCLHELQQEADKV